MCLHSRCSERCACTHAFSPWQSNPLVAIHLPSHLSIASCPSCDSHVLATTCSIRTDTPLATTICLCSRVLSLPRCPARGDVFALTWPSGRFAHVSPRGDVTLHEYPGRGDGEGAHPRTGRYRCVCRALVVVPSAWGAPSDVYVYQHPLLLPALPPLSLLTHPYSLPLAHRLTHVKVFTEIPPISPCSFTPLHCRPTDTVSNPKEIFYVSFSLAHAHAHSHSPYFHLVRSFPCTADRQLLDQLGRRRASFQRWIEDCECGSSRRRRHAT
jgi:hypothetical protein